MTVTLCVLLWARDGHDEALVVYEDQVLQLLPHHGARLLQRARGSGKAGEPLEVQFIEFPSEDAFNAYMVDDRRVAMSAERDRVVDQTQVLRVDLVEPLPGL